MATGVGLFAPAINWAQQLKNNGLDDRQIIAEEVGAFERSPKYHWMITGERYYLGDNEAITRKQKYKYDAREQRVVDEDAINNKLVHSFMHNLVDDKVAYLLAKEPTIKGDNEAYIELIRETLGQPFFEQRLETLCEEASNKGIGWLYVYINEQGEFKTLVFPAQQIVPIWSDDDHTQLQAVIRTYEQTEYIGSRKEIVKRVDLYTLDGVYHYDLRGGALAPNTNYREFPTAYLKRGRGGAPAGWGAIPFIAVKNNSYEYPDIKFVKSLIDDYDDKRSENANFLDIARRLVWVLKGYGEEDLHKLAGKIAHYNAINVDDATEGGVEAISPSVDLGGYDTHFAQLKRDILEFGQGVNKNLDDIGAAPSGVALKFLYSGLDLKCNKLEKSLKTAFRKLLEFVDTYLSLTGRAVPKEPVEIIFNRSVMVNESEAIQNVVASTATISRKTAVAHHPWVQDAEQEMLDMAEEQDDEEQRLYNKAPVTNNAQQG